MGSESRVLPGSISIYPLPTARLLLEQRGLNVEMGRRGSAVEAILGICRLYSIMTIFKSMMSLRCLLNRIQKAPLHHEYTSLVYQTAMSLKTIHLSGVSFDIFLIGCCKRDDV